VSNAEMANPGDQANEADLVERLRRGEPAAVEELYNTYFDRLYSLVFNQVGRNHHIAEEIVQETFLAALNSASKFRGQSKLYTWLCSIAYRKVADFYRQQQREGRRQIQPPSIDALDISQIRSREPPVSSLMESEESRQVIEQALLRLPLNYQQVLIFKYVEEMSISGISQIMDRSPKSVEGLLARAKKALRAGLDISGEV
jgi:RNA polymerase sigma-70 factor (ECF subfamily)